MAKIDGDIAAGLSRGVMKLTELAVTGGTSNAGAGAAMAMSAIAGPLFMGAGLLSKGFADQPDNGKTIHPATFATPDAILVYCLLLSRALVSFDDGTGHGAVALELSPETYLAGFDDFKKLSATPIDQVVRSDLLRQSIESAATAAVSVEALMERLQAPSADKLH